MPRVRGKTSAHRKVSPWGYHIAAQCGVFGPHRLVSIVSASAAAARLNAPTCAALFGVGIEKPWFCAGVRVGVGLLGSPQNAKKPPAVNWWLLGLSRVRPMPVCYEQDAPLGNNGQAEAKNSEVQRLRVSGRAR